MIVTVASAFPTIRSRDLESALAAAYLNSQTPVSDLATAEGSSAIYAKFARLIIDQAGDSELARSLPGLLVLGEASITPGTFSARPYNALMRGHIGRNRTWQDLGRLTPDTLFTFTNIGMSSVLEIVATAAHVSVAALDAGSIAPESPIDTPTTPPLLGDSTGISTDSRTFGLGGSAADSLATVAQWMQEITLASDLREALVELTDRGASVPEDVAAAWQAFLNLPLSSLAPPTDPGAYARIVADIDEVLGDYRRHLIFWSRIRPSPQPFGELGDQCGVTRERVRQIQVKVEEEVRALLAGSPYAPLRWRAREVARLLGLGFPAKAAAFRKAMDTMTCDLPVEVVDRVVVLLLWFGGPYRGSPDGWLLRADLPQSTLIQDAVDDFGRLDVHQLRSELTRSGLVGWAADAWIDQYVNLREIDGVTYLWQGSVADKATIVLTALGEPATAEAITEAIGEGHGVRSTRTRILEDPRFKRVDRVRVGLREWEDDEYTGIADEICEEIERHGGQADVRVLIATVAANYALKATSVEAYTTAPRFVLEDGTIRLRRGDEPYRPRRAIQDEARVYVLDVHRCAYRLLVDGEVLRGSGRTLPEGLGVWLGVMPGGRRVMTIESDEVPITWPDSALLGPSIGSLRRTAAAKGARAGDQLLLLINRDKSEAAVQLLREEDLEAAVPSERLSMLTGVEGVGRVLEQHLSEAVGAESLTTLRQRLRSRGENDLIALLPDRGVDLSDALDRLKQVL